MRLTLRTMLCYLDDVLEPADAVELGKKIEDSEYASQVVHRIRTSMRRLRLGAPKLSGEGAGYDPNLVADYLDNTLPPEQVADFERVCLDPDTEVQLAEVAACHQILTLVLGEPAEVPQSMRQRIYDLPHLVAGKRASHGTNGVANGEAISPALAAETLAATSAVVAPAASEAATATAPAESTAQVEPRRVEEADVARRERHKPEVPAYLKESTGKRRWIPALIVLGLIGVAVGGIVWATRNNNQQPVAVGPTKNNDDKKLFEDDTDDKTPATGGGRTAVVASTGGKEPKEQPAGGASGDEEDADETPAAATDGAAEGLPIDDLNVEPGEGDGEPAATTAGAAAEKDPTNGESVARVEPGDGATAPPAADDVAALPLVDKVIGHYISTGQVLNVFDPAADTWTRLASRSGVKPGMHLRSLPTFRPQVLLENAVQITLSGDGELTLGNPTDDGTPFVIMPFGRAIFATMGKAGNAVVLRAGEREAMLTMVNADAAVALEVRRFQLPGVDPATELAHDEVTLFVTSGQIQWQDAGGESLTLDAGQQLTFIDENTATVAAAAAPPKWTKSSDISDIDRRASATLEPLLADSGPIEVKLEELAEDPRVEVRSLAMRSLASLDRYERILEAFKDETLKSYWAQHIDQLQAALAHGAPAAAEVRAAAVRASGAEGDGIYRVLWGYNPEQLKAGGAKHLVDLLKHPSMDFRVLAINTLRHITGRTQGYHPHLPEARRRTAERQWEVSLTDGDVVYGTPPASLPTRKLPENP